MSGDSRFLGFWYVLPYVLGLLVFTAIRQRHRDHRRREVDRHLEQGFVQGPSPFAVASPTGVTGAERRRNGALGERKANAAFQSGAGALDCRPMSPFAPDEADAFADPG
ncbi:hypothetical protein CNY89_18105 [Amaricoccus sp. HAR-UPW-R2A-40]|nr:hypothetical protein CNY89_18105 [Amaricoccus sp. HAR-UPW-R2A-40]